VTLEEFIEYYTNISASIDDDIYFSQMMNSSWNISGDAAQYKKFDKGWANEDEKPSTGYQRKNVIPATNQPTLKSGVMSSDSPFGHMSKYYDRPASPR
jgi:hypothetical protein